MTAICTVILSDPSQQEEMSFVKLGFFNNAGMEVM